ncbi:hypothetical protein DRO42_07940, partial [Candidatus Bathyarchaeota archaeon]
MQVLLLIIFLTGVVHAAATPAAAESPYYHPAVDLDLNDDGRLGFSELFAIFLGTHLRSNYSRIDFNRDGRCDLRDWKIVVYTLKTY